MNSIKSKVTLIIFAVLSANAAWAQAEGSSSGFGSYLVYGLIVVAVLVFFMIILQVADNLMVIEAKQSGADKDGANFSIFPGWKELFAPRLPEYLRGKSLTFLRRGHTINLEGEAEQTLDETVQVKTFAVQPPNFPGISPIPKVVVEVGDEVKAGDHLFFDKQRPEVVYVAPVSGEVIAINRGAKRSIKEVVILADKEVKYRELKPFDLEGSSRESLVEYLLDAGVWPFIRQRPYNIVAEHDVVPRDIFVSTFDTAPLAPNLNFVIQGQEEAFQKGLDVLNKLSGGKVYLGLDGRGKEKPHAAFTDAKGVEIHYFHGKHPAGNVGVQIHHLKPISAGDKVWTLGVQEVATIGRLFIEKRFDARRVVALAGAELGQAKYVRTYLGANIGDLVKGNLSEGHIRLISGDVLSGQKKAAENFLDFFDDQVTAVLEGDDYELFGWLIPSLNTPSISPTLPSTLLPKMKKRAETNTHGEKRAFVVTGIYESVLPMDIYPQELMKSILIGDFEKIEGLGIYELSEEDVALCEFVCVSKQPVQQILRKGLDMMREQG